MPSPFPGMDPYLEGEMWQEFHETLAAEIRSQLLAQLPANYDQPPPPPPLSDEDAAWVGERLRKAGVRQGQGAP